MIAWGKTGRVVLESDKSGRFNNILLDGRHVGIADAYKGAWWAGRGAGENIPDAPLS